MYGSGVRIGMERTMVLNREIRTVAMV